MKDTSVVDIEYEGRLDNGKVFDTNKEAVAKKEGIFQNGRDYKPLRVTVGQGYVIKGFENALIGMKEGEEKDVVIPPAEGYGFPRQELIKTVEKKMFGDKLVKKGEVVLVTIQGQNVPATIVNVHDEKVELNFNHPLAGATLHFKIKVVKIE